MHTAKGKLQSIKLKHNTTYIASCFAEALTMSSLETVPPFNSVGVWRGGKDPTKLMQLCAGVPVSKFSGPPWNGASSTPKLPVTWCPHREPGPPFGVRYNTLRRQGSAHVNACHSSVKVLREGKEHKTGQDDWCKSQLHKCGEENEVKLYICSVLFVRKKTLWWFSHNRNSLFGGPKLHGCM